MYVNNCWPKKILKADTIGSGVPLGHFSVKIHSIFQKAINLQLCSLSPSPTNTSLSQNDFITILNYKSINHPKSICLKTIEDFNTYNLTPNTVSNFNTHGVTLSSVNDASLYISFNEVVRLKDRLLPSITKLSTTWKTSIDLLSTMQVQAETNLKIANLIYGLTSTALDRPLTDVALALGKLVSNGNRDNLYAAITKLIGLGPGLTPSGDDFLCGFITAAHCRCEVNLEYLHEFNYLVQTRLTNTNEISAKLLLAAIEKDACSALYDLAIAIYEDTCSKKALIDLSTLGHSSGMDIATGFLYGLLVWGN